MSIEITTAGELQAMSADPTADYVLAGDIDWNDATGGGDFEPVGTFEPPLYQDWSGSFDGQGHTISNLSIDHTGWACGIFGYRLLGDGTIRNVGLIDPMVVGNTNTLAGTGALIGFGSTIANCFVRGGSVQGVGGFPVGGLAGEATTITDCYCTANVTGDNDSGGIVGKNSGSNYPQRCYTAKGSVETSGTNAGGIIGFQNGGTTKHCFSTATVNGAAAGYVSGKEAGDADNCWWVDQTGDDATAGNADPGRTHNEETELSALYTPDHAVYAAVSPAWDFAEGGDWQEIAGDFPRLAWETILAPVPYHLAAAETFLATAAGGQTFNSGQTAGIIDG